eukprot:11382036-Alexandrium_andersonii.AAC.1
MLCRSGRLVLGAAEHRRPGEGYSRPFCKHEYDYYGLLITIRADRNMSLVFGLSSPKSPMTTNAL